MVDLCTAAIVRLFKKDTYSAAVVTAVRAIDAYAQKRKYRMASVLLECLLTLKLTEDADEKLRKLKDQQKKERKEKNKKNAGTVKLQTDAELERDMNESSAVMDTQSRKLAQAAMLRAMFLSYFRVLKSPRRLGPGVLGATLAGLGHFSHLISIDFLGDLFTCLNTLLRQGGVLPATVEEDLPAPPAFDDDGEEYDGEEEFKLSVPDALTAAHAAMMLLTGERGETLEIDPQTTCTALYFLLPQLAVQEYDDMIPTALDALRLILLQRRQLSMPRVGAFLKAVISLAAATPMPHSAIACTAFARQLLLRYPKVRRLLESVDEGQQTMGGVVGLGLGPRGYRNDVEPDHANALESTAWELSTLIKHWHPHVSAHAIPTITRSPGMPLRLFLVAGERRGEWTDGGERRGGADEPGAGVGPGHGRRQLALAHVQRERGRRVLAVFPGSAAREDCSVLAARPRAGGAGRGRAVVGGAAGAAEVLREGERPVLGQERGVAGYGGGWDGYGVAELPRGDGEDRAHGIACLTLVTNETLEFSSASRSNRLSRSDHRTLICRNISELQSPDVVQIRPLPITSVSIAARQPQIFLHGGTCWPRRTCVSCSRVVVRTSPPRYENVWSGHLYVNFELFAHLVALPEAIPTHQRPLADDENSPSYRRNRTPHRRGR